jgi:hypothetical protein
MAYGATLVSRLLVYPEEREREYAHAWDVVEIR